MSCFPRRASSLRTPTGVPRSRRPSVGARRQSNPCLAGSFAGSRPNRLEVRRWLAAEHVPLPGSTFLARLSLQARAFARAAGASEEAVRRDIAELGTLLARVSSLREEGVIGGPEVNAADLQIASSVRALDLFSDLAPLIANHPAVSYARELFPDFPAGPPAQLPREWLTPLRG